MSDGYNCCRDEQQAGHGRQRPFSASKARLTFHFCPFDSAHLCLRHWRRQDRLRRFAFCLLLCRVCCLLTSGFVRHHAEEAHGLGDILDLLWPEIFIAQGQLILDMVMNSARNANTARLGETLHAGGDVDPPSPYKRSPSTITSPRLMPIRKRI